MNVLDRAIATRTATPSATTMSAVRMMAGVRLVTFSVKRLLALPLCFLTRERITRLPWLRI